MTGHIRRRYDSSWTVVLDLGRDPITGKRQRKQRSIKGTKRDAKRLLQRMKQEAEQGAIIPTTTRSMTLAEVIADWMRHLKAQQRAIRTREIYESCSIRILEALGHVPVEKIQPIHIQRFCDSLQLDGARRDKTADGKRRPGGLSPKTVQHHHSTIHAALAFAQRMGLIGRNPAEGIALPKRQRREPQILDRDQLQTLLESLEGTRWFILYYIGAHTGLRVGELCGLQWQDIDWQEPAINVRRSLTRTKRGQHLGPVKNRERRTVYLREADAEVLRTHKNHQEVARKMNAGIWPHPDHVITTPDGNLLHTTVPTNMLKKLCSGLGLPEMTMHDLRHMHGSHLLAYDGWDLAAVSERLGHHSVAFTAQVYAHAIPGIQKRYIQGGRN